MNFLQICQRTAVECGVPAASPTTVVSQANQTQRIINWVGDAWNDIQMAHPDWGWMRTSTSFTTVAGQAAYPLGTGAGTCEVAESDFSAWIKPTARNYVTSVGTDSENPMGWIDYDIWRDKDYLGALRNSRSRPNEIAIRPDKAVMLGPVPDSGYTITLDYFSTPTTMAADADTPTGLPDRYHMMLVYRAMMFYGGFEAATEVYQRGELEFKRMMRRLTAQYLPEITLPGPMA